MRNAIKRLVRDRRKSRVRKLNASIEASNRIIYHVDEELWPGDVRAAKHVRARASRERANLLAKLHMED